MDKINILYSFDNNFWRMAAISIKSLVDAQKYPERVVVHCMVARRTHGKRVIKQIVNGAGAKLVWCTVSKRQNPFYNHYHARWSPVIFYRLFSYRFFPSVEKMLYLDSDTLILDDLTELYNTDVSQHVLGAVRDMAPTEKEDVPGSKEVKAFEDNILKHGVYVNSGVLLMNQAKMRENKDLLLNIQVPLRFPDQDIINAAFDGRIKILPLRYNFVPQIYISKKFSKAEALLAKKNPVIYHFYSYKPYYYDGAPTKIYSMFYRACTALGFYPEDFARKDLKWRMKKEWARFGKQTNIPHLYLTKRGRLRLFGILRV
ncbi:MAG: glycosyltransferase family 8 protein [Alphaproteobacteria bacterium]|nr:glycosyltransferase family 8 protein [Alphaproteobacteria bacterium]